MRVFEILLLAAQVLTLLILSVPRWRSTAWLRVSASVAMLIGVAQILAEGPRWQLMPVYALTAFLCCISMLAHGAAAGGPCRVRHWTWLSLGIGLPWLALSIALPLCVPVFRFPTPSGPYPIGTLTYHWIDPTRSEAWAADAPSRRELMAQVWYPASANPKLRRAAYLPDAAAVTAAFARILGQPAFLFGHFKYVMSNAMLAAPPAIDQPSFPVLLFLEGATGFRQMNTYQVEHLVSHGYIVVALDQPGVAAVVVFPDGRQAASLTLAQFQPVVRPSYMPGLTDPPVGGLPQPGGKPPAQTSIVPYLARDVSFALDRLTAMNQADPAGILAGKLDLQRVGAFGVSLGGIVVGEACRLDPRLRACLMMDAPAAISVVQAGLKQPSMWITRDAASMRLERRRAGGWPEAEIEAHQTSMRAAYEALSGAGYFVRVPGTFHSNFTDVPNWTPLASILGLAGPINAQRAHRIVNACSLAFFDRELRGRAAQLLDVPSMLYPEVLFESRRP